MSSSFGLKGNFSQRIPYFCEYFKSPFEKNTKRLNLHSENLKFPPSPSGVVTFKGCLYNISIFGSVPNVSKCNMDLVHSVELHGKPSIPSYIWY